MLPLVLFGLVMTPACADPLEVVRSHAEARRWAEARAELRAVCAEEVAPDPSFWSVAARLAGSLLDPVLELELWERAERGAFDGRLGRARALIALGRDREARPLLEALLEEPSIGHAGGDGAGNPRIAARLSLAEVLRHLEAEGNELAASELSSAEAELDDLARAGPLGTQLALRRWQLDQDAGFEELQPILDWYRTHPEHDPRARFEAGLQGVPALCFEGRAAEARQLYDALLLELRQRASADPLLMARKELAGGALLFFEGDAEGSRDALSVAERSLTELLAPSDQRLVTARIKLAVACEALGDLEGGARTMRDSVHALASRVETDEELLDARRALASFLFGLEEYAEAAEQETLVLEAAEAVYGEDDRRLYFARINLGASLWELGERQRALELARSGRLGLERLLPWTDEEVIGCARREANYLLRLDRPGEAVELMRQHVDRLAQERGSFDESLVRHRLLLVRALHRSGEGVAADAELQELLAGVGDERLGSWDAGLLMTLGARLITAGRQGRAEEVFELALARRRAEGPPDAVEGVELELLGVRVSLGRAVEVEPRLRAIVADQETRGETDPLLLWSAWSKLARCLQSQTRFAEAVEWNRRAIDALASTYRPTYPNLMISRLNLLEALFGADALDGAQEEIDRLAALAGTLGDGGVMRARVLGFRGRLAYLRGHQAQARALYLEADALLAERLPKEHPVRTTLRQRLASVINQGGDERAAATYAEENLLALQDRHEDDHPLVLNAMADYAATLGGDDPEEVDLAIELLERALRGLEPLHQEGSPTLLSIRANLAGRLRMRDGPTDQVLDLTLRVLKARERTLPEGHPRLESVRSEYTLLLMDRGNPEPARAQLRREWELWDPTQARGWMTGKLRMAVLARLGGRAEGELLEHAYQLADGILQGLRRERSLRSQRELWDYANAAGSTTWTLDFASTLEGLSPGAGLELRRLAFTLREAVRGTAGEAAREARRELREAGLAGLRTELRAAAAELARLAAVGADDEDLFEARRERDRLERRMLERLPRVQAEAAAGSTGTLALDVGELAATLGPDEAYVGWFEAWRFDPELLKVERGPFCAYVLRSEGRLERVELGDLEEVYWAAARWGTAVSAAASRLHRGVGMDDLAELPDERLLGQALRELVFDPLLPHLEGVRNLFLSPEQQLCALPLDALPMGEGRLGDRWRTTILWSSWELALDEPRARAERDLVLFGGIDYDAGREPSESRPAPRFELLPATGREVEAIADLRSRLVPGVAPVVRMGGDATTTALEALLPKSRIVHLATHGWHSQRVSSPEREEQEMLRLDRNEDLWTSNPGVLSGLALAGANHHEAGATLAAEELSLFDLSSCELAVLSACEGAHGVIDPGVAFHSLQTALRYAGARTVLAAAWPVPDEATRELMEAFYRGLWEEGLDPADALWSAKRALRDPRDADGRPLHPPSHWAAWILAGPGWEAGSRDR